MVTKSRHYHIAMWVEISDDTQVVHRLPEVYRTRSSADWARLPSSCERWYKVRECFRDDCD